MEQFFRAVSVLCCTPSFVLGVAALGVVFGLVIAFLSRRWVRLREAQGKGRVAEWTYLVVGGSVVFVSLLFALTALTTNPRMVAIFELVMGLVGLSTCVFIFWVVRKKGV